MKRITDSEIFKYTESAYHTGDRIVPVVTGKVGKDVTSELSEELESLPKFYRNDPIVLKALQMVENGSLRFVYGDPDKMLPAFMPFVTVMTKDGPAVIFDLTSSTFVYKQDRYTKAEYCDMDIRQLYSMCMTAVFVIDMGKNTILPSTVNGTTAMWWAKMFCKVLNRHMNLNANRDLYNTFLYLAMKYYLINILELSEKLADETASNQFRDGKTTMMRTIEGKMLQLAPDAYSSFASFCSAIFNYEITGLGGMRANNSSMNMSTFISLFIGIYDIKSLFTLATFPYFLYMAIATNNADRGFNRRIVEDVMVEPKPYAVMITELTKMVR